MSFFPGMAAVKKKRRAASRDDPGHVNPFGPPPAPTPPKPPPSITGEQIMRGLRFMNEAVRRAELLQIDTSITPLTRVMNLEQNKNAKAMMQYADWFWKTGAKNKDLAQYDKDSPVERLALEAVSPVSSAGGGGGGRPNFTEGDRYLAGAQLVSYIKAQDIGIKQAGATAKEEVETVVGPMVSSINSIGLDIINRAKMVKAIKFSAHKVAHASSHRPGKFDPGGSTMWEEGEPLSPPKGTAAFSSWLQAKNTADADFYAAQEAKIKADEAARQLKMKNDELNYWQQQYKSAQDQYEQQVRDYNDRIASGTAPGWMTAPSTYTMDSAKREVERRGGDVRQLTNALAMFNQTIFNYSQLYPALVAAIQRYGPMGGGAVSPEYDPDYTPHTPIPQTQPPSQLNPTLFSGLLGLDAITFSIGPSVSYVPVYRPAPLWVAAPVELTNKNIFYILAGTVLIYLGLKGKK